MNELLITAVNLIVYLKTLSLGHVVDDKQSYGLYKGWHRGFKVNFRNVTDYVCRRLYGAGTFRNKYLDRLVTIVLWNLLCLGVYWLIGGHIGLMTALLVAVNPINNQLSIWLNGRRYIISILCGSLLLVHPLGILSYFFVPLFQVNSILMFALLPFTDHAYLLWLVPIVYLYKGNVFTKFLSVRVNGVPDGECKNVHPKKLIVMVKTLGFYLLHTLLPVRKLMWYSYLQRYTVTHDGNKDAFKLSWDFWCSLAALIGLVYFGVVTKSVGIGLWFLFILQWSNIVTYTQHLADRYASLPGICLMWSLAELLNGFAYGHLIFAVIFVLYVLGTLKTMEMYKDLDSFLDYHIYYHPENVAAGTFKSILYAKNKDTVNSLATIIKTYEYNKLDFKVNFLIAEAFILLGQVDAINHINVAYQNVYVGQEHKLVPILNKLRDKYDKAFPKEVREKYYANS